VSMAAVRRTRSAPVLLLTGVGLGRASAGRSAACSCGSLPRADPDDAGDAVCFAAGAVGHRDFRRQRRVLALPLGRPLLPPPVIAAGETPSNSHNVRLDARPSSLRSGHTVPGRSDSMPIAFFNATLPVPHADDLGAQIGNSSSASARVRGAGRLSPGRPAVPRARTHTAPRAQPQLLGHRLHPSDRRAASAPPRAVCTSSS